MKRLWQINITICALCTMSMFLFNLNTFGQQTPEYRILCPPNDGVSSNGSYSDEPLKQDLKTGQITRLTSVERAIAKVACQHDNAISDIEEQVDAIDALVTEITCSDQIKNGDETDLDCGGSCPTKCDVGDDCLVNDDCQSGSCTDLTCH